jgi:hypothetical protein
MENAYLQLCPRAYLQFLPKELGNDKVLPLSAMRDPRDLIMKVRDIYRGETGKDGWHNDLEKRGKVKFKILVSFKLES